LNDTTTFSATPVTLTTGSWLLTAAASTYPMGWSKNVVATCTYGVNKGLTIVSEPLSVTVANCGANVQTADITQKQVIAYSATATPSESWMVKTLFTNTDCAV